MKNKPTLKSLCKPIDPKNPFNQPQHTPTPLGPQNQIGQIVTDIKQCMETYPEEEVNYIVRAVNAYEGLLEAAKIALDSIQMEGSISEPMVYAHSVLKATIAKAEGK